MRVRRKVRGTGKRPRLAVFRSLSHIYAQLVDDERGVTLASASSLESEVRGDRGGKKKTEVSREVGALIGKRARAEGVAQVVFDRGGNKYHGRVKELAEAVRREGVAF
jgi:large subunit ribosomal protein L18